MSDVDKRSTHTDALATLGSIISEKEKRDAIHLAVIPVLATTWLKPGEVVGIHGKLSSKDTKPIGIVDPFLTRTVKAGEWFWLIIYPRQITSLRHVWTHPDVPEDEDFVATEPETVESPNKVSMDFIEAEAANLQITYDELMEMCKDYLEHGHTPCFGHTDIYDESPQKILMHYGVITGATITYEQRENFYFRCAC